MAGVSTKEIKNRIRSMESTRQITKAMEMVAASKLRRAQAQVLSSRPYFEILYSTIADIASSNRDFSSPYLQERPVKKVMYIVIAGDRGLAGGYNSNILKLVQSEIAGKDAVVLPIGKKALDYFRSKQIPTFTEHYAEAAELTVGDCFSVSKQVSKAFLAGEFDQIVIAYTNFVSVLAQTPAAMQLLPLKKPEKKESTNQGDILYEGDAGDHRDRRRFLSPRRGGILIAQSPEVTNLRYLMSVKPGILGKSGYSPRVLFRKYFSRRS